MPRRECCGAWTDQPHRSTCREPLRPARAEDVERARRAETSSSSEGQWQALRRRMNNAGFVAGVDFQCHGAILAGLDIGRAPAVGIDLPLAMQIREALRRGAKVTICGEAVTSKTIHACKGTAARFDVERIAGHWTIIDTDTKAGMMITFCPFCGEKLVTEGA